jgi:nitroreductase
MKKRLSRRNILKQGLALGGGAAWLSGTGRLGAAPVPEPVAENETLRTLMNLRTIHGNFTERDIPDDRVEQILEACVRAANSSNIQCYSIIVVKDREKMRQVCGYQGSRMLVFCADYTRLHDTAAHLGHSYRTDTIVNFVTASMDAMLVAQTAVIAAKSLGIDSLLTNGVHRGDMERVWRILELPAESCFPMIALVLGYPDAEPAALKGRLSDGGVIHRGTYRRLTKEELDALVVRYDDKQARLGLNEDWDKKGYAHYLDWLFTEWLGRNAGPATQETQMFKLLKRSGFVELQKT